ncbi:MAG TPA: hypothetical protein VKA53_09645, partial [Thermoanaerobaculia bacterium]|nr:hypothetical protein [Thermoanaerobaculia bacterium]
MRATALRLTLGFLPFLLLALGALAAPARAQEPTPAVLTAAYFQDPAGVALDYAWRYAPGSACASAMECASPGFDDGAWKDVKPELTPKDLPAGAWRGTGWFRRHLVVEPGVQDRKIALRFQAPGVAQAYLDGRLVLDTEGTGAPAEIPADHRSAVILTFAGPKHLLAVRYLYPTDDLSGRAR